jgi:hypothetical protein
VVVEEEPLLLSHDEQTMLTLRIDQKLSWDEVAEVLQATGAPPTAATLAKRYERLTRRLRKLAQRDGLLE